MKSKKTITRLLACILCVLSITALLPTVAFAAEPETDAVAAVTNKIAAEVKSNASQVVYIGCWYSCEVPTNWYLNGCPIAVKYQWQVKKGCYRSWTNIRGANSYRYTFKATKGKNGWKYRCRITGKYIRTKPVYRTFATLKVRYW